MSIFSSQVVKDTHEHFTARRRASCVRRAAEASEMRERGAQNEAHRNPRRVSRQPEEATGTGKCVRGVCRMDPIGTQKLPRGGFTVAGTNHWDRRNA